MLRVNRTVDRLTIAPPLMPMVFCVRNCVRAARMLPELDWGGGRAASRALGVPGNPVAGYSGLA